MSWLCPIPTACASHTSQRLSCWHAPCRCSNVKSIRRGRRQGTAWASAVFAVDKHQLTPIAPCWLCSDRSFLIRDHAATRPAFHTEWDTGGSSDSSVRVTRGAAIDGCLRCRSLSAAPWHETGRPPLNHARGALRNLGDGNDSVSGLSASLVGPDTAVLSWAQPAAGADSYELSLQRGSALVFVQRIPVDAAQREEPVLYYRLTGLRPATTYNVTLAAILAGQEGPAASILFTTAPLVTPTTPATPSTAGVMNGPTSIQAIPLSSSSVLVLWGPLAPYVAGGQYRVGVLDAEDSARFIDVGYALSTIVQDLDPSENYTISVQWCPSPNICSSSVSTTRVANAPKLPVPTNVTVTAVGASYINVTWQLPANNSYDITGYQVSWCLSDACAGKLNDMTAGTSYSVQGLQDFKNYTVFVCAYLNRDLTTFVGQCANVSAKTRPGAPIGGVALPLSQSSILVLWAPKPGCPSISLYQLRVANPTPSADWASTENTQYTFSYLQSRTSYTFQLRWCPLPGTCSLPVNITGSTV